MWLLQAQCATSALKSRNHLVLKELCWNSGLLLYGYAVNVSSQKTVIEYITNAEGNKPIEHVATEETYHYMIWLFGLKIMCESLSRIKDTSLNVRHFYKL